MAFFFLILYITVHARILREGALGFARYSPMRERGCRLDERWRRTRERTDSPLTSQRPRFRQHRLNGLYHACMNLLPCRDDAKIPAERAAKTKVERAPKIIRDDSTGLFDEERPRGMILKPT
jgi:hypothetical protein